MKLAGFLILGVLPSAAVAYAALTGYLLNRVRPAPILVVPREGVRELDLPVEAIAA